MNCTAIMTRLNSALNRIDALYAALARRSGLTYNSLMLVYLLGEGEPVTQKTVCDVLHIPKSTVHSILVDLMEQGWVALRPIPRSREKQIAVTPEGLERFQRIWAETDRLESAALAALGEEQCLRMAAGAERFAAAMDAALGQLPPPEV